MKIKKLKRKCIILSITLIVTGLLISAAGLGMAGFHYNKLGGSGYKEAWYHTIHINGDNVWYGIDFGNNAQMVVIGNAK